MSKSVNKGANTCQTQNTDEVALNGWSLTDLVVSLLTSVCCSKWRLQTSDMSLSELVLTLQLSSSVKNNKQMLTGRAEGDLYKTAKFYCRHRTEQCE